MSRPLKELLARLPAIHDRRSKVGKTAYEMARRLRKLDDYMSKASNTMECDDGVQRHIILAEVVRHILDGAE